MEGDDSVGVPGPVDCGWPFGGVPASGVLGRLPSPEYDAAATMTNAVTTTETTASQMRAFTG